MKLRLFSHSSSWACSRMLGALRPPSCASSLWRTWLLSCTSYCKRPFPHPRPWTWPCLGRWQGLSRTVRLSILTAHRLPHEIGDLSGGKASDRSCTRSDRHSGSSWSRGLAAHRGCSGRHGVTLRALGLGMPCKLFHQLWRKVLDMMYNRVLRTTDLNIPSD